MVFRPCSPRSSFWPADYRSLAVELQRLIEAGTITKQEMQIRLGDMFPEQKRDPPHERTVRRWKRGKYRDLPEQRRHFFGTQAMDPDRGQEQILVTPQAYPYPMPRMPSPSRLPRIEELFQPIMNFVVTLAMIRTAASVCDRVGKSLNETLSGTT